MDYDGLAGLKVQLRSTVVEEDGRANRTALRSQWRRFDSRRGRRRRLKSFETDGPTAGRS